MTVLRVLTNSERSTLACPRRWWFRYDQGLTTSDSPMPLRTGSLWHQCLAAYYRSVQHPPVLTWDEVVAAVIAPWREQRAAWAEAHFAGIEEINRRSEVLEEDDQAAKLVAAMLQGYVAAWGAQDAERYEVLHVEAQVSRWLPHPVHGSALRDRLTVRGENGSRRAAAWRRWAYGGAVDLVVRDRSTGEAWVVEHKTTAESDLPTHLRKLHWDPQIRGYAWALADPLPVGDVREPVRVAGVIYDVARKKIPREPELLKDGSRLSKAKIDTTREVFLGAILHHGFNPDDYADVLEQASRNVFFARESYAFTDSELDDFARDAGHAALRVIAEGRAAYHPRQLTECGGPGRMLCPYLDLCAPGADGPMSRRSYSVLAIRHAEMHGEMAEPGVGAERMVATPTTISSIDPFTEGG